MLELLSARMVTDCEPFCNAHVGCSEDTTVIDWGCKKNVLAAGEVVGGECKRATVRVSCSTVKGRCRTSKKRIYNN